MDHLRASRVTVADLLHKQARAHPDATALTDGVRTFSFAQLEVRVRQLAQALRGQGIASGDRVDRAARWLGRGQLALAHRAGRRRLCAQR
jgi:non-ribosomal peptide synthetase component F